MSYSFRPSINAQALEIIVRYVGQVPVFGLELSTGTTFALVWAMENKCPGTGLAGFSGSVNARDPERDSWPIRQQRRDEVELQSSIKANPK